MATDRTGDARFPTTHASAVRGVGSDQQATRERSWDSLIAAYWKPAYKHVRVKWRAPKEAAEDAVQGFFERAMTQDFFAEYNVERGRFRTFFRLCLDRHVSNERKGEARQKRGGGKLALDFDAAEAEMARAGAATWESPEDCFDREWKRSVLSLSVSSLERKLAADGRATAYALFARYDLSEPEVRPTYAELARELDVPVTTVTNQLALARRELRLLVLSRLEEITGTRAELRAEASAIFGAG